MENKFPKADNWPFGITEIEMLSIREKGFLSVPRNARI